MKNWLFASLVACLAAPCCAGEPAELLDAVQERFAGYLDAFNGGDAQRLAAYWAESAVSLDETTGEQTVGREAILEGFRTFHDATPGARLTGGVDEVRAIRPDVAIADGSVTLYAPGAEPAPSAFTAVLVNNGDGWVIESSQERDLPAPATPSDALKDLDWLVGDWRDDTEGVEVNTTVRWSANGAFLIRSFQADYSDGEHFEGTQVIGWDPRSKQYRTWSFNSDGSFGDGVISRSGGDWLVKMTHVNSDGSVATGVQVISQVDDDTMRVKKIGQTVDGAPVPSEGAVTVVRVESAAKAAAGGETTR